MEFDQIRRAAEALDAPTAQSFVRAAKNVLDALMIEGAAARQTQTPPQRDYRTAELDRGAPAGGWIGNDELRGAAQRIAEAIATEKWIDGVAFAIRALQIVGG